MKREKTLIIDKLFYFSNFFHDLCISTIKFVNVRKEKKKKNEKEKKNFKNKQVKN